MGYTIVSAQVTDQTLRVTNEPTLASGGVNEIEVAFTFCGLWAGLLKTAVFYRNENEVYHQLLDGENKCIMPHEVAGDEGTVYFGVFGIDGTGDQTRTSEVVALTFKKGAITTATKVPDPTPDIYAQIVKCVQLHPTFANSTDDCTDTTQLYVLPDGYIYAYLKGMAYPVISIENVGEGYWYYNGTKEQWYTASGLGAMSKQTNYIPVTEGDTIRYTGQKSYGNEVNLSWYDANKTFISCECLTDNATAVVVTVPNGAKYVRFYSYRYTSDNDAVVLTVEWLSCAAAEGYSWANTGHAFVPADYEDRIIALEESVEELEAGITDNLKGKKIVFDGDSICADWSSAGNGGAYPKLLADACGCVSVNQAVGGGRFKSLATGESYHSIADNLVNLPADADLYCFEGGVNDHWHNTPLGNFSPSDYTGELDTTTFCGAVEKVCRYALDNFVGKPVCFIITHKCLYSAFSENDLGLTFADYREKMIGILNKYSIPHYDAFAESGLNGLNTVQQQNFFLLEDGVSDGCHPNEDGYKRYYVPQLLALFRKIMPVE